MVRLLAVTVVAIALFAMGCYSAPVMPPSGLLFTNIEAPVSPAVAGRPIGSRSGEASSRAILGIVAWGDASVESAIRQGGVTEPQHIDYQYFNLIGLYQKFTTVVHGE